MAHPQVFGGPVAPPSVSLADPYASALEHDSEARKGRLAPVVVVFAGKGGCAKTTTSLYLAHRASQVGGLKVAVVDLSRGQGDIRHYLRVNQASLPSVYDAALSGDPKRAISSPETVNKARRPGMAEIDFGVALAPSDTQGDPSFVTAEVYASVVTEARQIADLVIVDTQILESHDTSGLINGVAVPLLHSTGGWGLGLSDASVPGVQNLIRRYRALDAARVGPTRLMSGFARIPIDTQFDEQGVVELLSGYAHFVGTVHVSAEVEAASGLGRFPSEPELDLLADRVLARVTGIAAFSPDRSGGRGGGRLGLFGRRKRGPRGAK